jgi:hypothetical protein
MENGVNVAAASVGKSIEQAMDSMMIGNFVVNLFVSASMKKLLQGIRVLQVLAFFVFIRVNFTPISELFL